MAYNPDRIHEGPGRIFVGVTNPATSVSIGTAPTKISHTSGVPSDGTELGLTDGEIKFEFNSKKNVIMAEQFYSGVAVALTEEDVTVTATVKEFNVSALKAAGFDNTGQATTGTEEMFWFGSGSGAFAPLTQSLLITVRQRVDPTKYIIILLYKTFINKALSLAFSRKKETMVPVSFPALADTARTAGDCVGQMFYEL